MGPDAGGPERSQRPEGPQGKVALGVPKGSLEEPTLKLFERVGLDFGGSERSLWLTSNDPEIVPVLLRPQEIPKYVETGKLDCGLAGLDWIREQRAEQGVVVLAELRYSKRSSRPVRWVLAVPEASPYRTVEDLRDEADRRADEGRAALTVSTELVATSKLWLAENGIAAEVQFSWGATEAKAGYFYDAIIEATETGSSLRANGLRIIETVTTSTTQFFANKRAYRTDPWKAAKIDGLAHLLSGALRADEVVQLTVVAEKALDLAELVPAGARVIEIAGGGDQAFHATVVLRKRDVPAALPALITAGASSAWVSTVDIFHDRLEGRRADRPPD
jgi:ATP phosphoribosyltransferase